jgi:hypothetical protein
MGTGLASRYKFLVITNEWSTGVWALYFGTGSSGKARVGSRSGRLKGSSLGGWWRSALGIGVKGWLYI